MYGILNKTLAIDLLNLPKFLALRVSLGKVRKLIVNRFYISIESGTSVFFSPVREKNQKITKRIKLPAAIVILRNEILVND